MMFEHLTYIFSSELTVVNKSISSLIPLKEIYNADVPSMIPCVCLEVCVAQEKHIHCLFELQLTFICSID